MHIMDLKIDNYEFPAIKLTRYPFSSLHEYSRLSGLTEPLQTLIMTT